MPPRRLQLPAVAAALAALAVLAAACSSAAAPPPTGPSPRASATAGPTPSTPLAPPPLAWSDCGGGFSCATLAVPLDYAAPDKGSVGLRLIRLPAQDPSARIGSLLVNPGGPGVSAVEFLRGFAGQSVPAALKRRFDLVAFDPRGTRDSSPVTCLGTAALDRYFHVDPDPDAPGEVSALDQQNRVLAAGCSARSGRILPYVSTDVAARDMDAVRAALGEARLTYLGYSYGTALGAAYLDRFPTHVRAMVLDGALDPRLSWSDLLSGQARGFDQAFGSFLAWCGAHAPSCAFRRAVPGDLGAAYDALAARVDAHDLPTRGTRTVGPGELSYGVGQALYSASYWPFLGDALAAAVGGDGSAVLQLSDLYLERTSSGYANTVEANFAVNCLDRPWPHQLSAYADLATRLRSVAPRFGPGIAWSGAGCAVWPVPPTGSPHPVRGAGSPPVVVIGTTRDPATPYAWAVGLAGQLQHAVLLTHVGDGHTVFRSGAPACIVDPVVSYLTTGTAPPAATC